MAFSRNFVHSTSSNALQSTPDWVNSYPGHRHDHRRHCIPAGRSSRVPGCTSPAGLLFPFVLCLHVRLLLADLGTPWPVPLPHRGGRFRTRRRAFLVLALTAGKPGVLRLLRSIVSGKWKLEMSAKETEGVLQATAGGGEAASRINADFEVLFILPF